jgi:hypothetical protein
MTTGPPVYSPKGKRSEHPLITETAVKQKEKFMKPLKPLWSSGL